MGCYCIKYKDIPLDVTVNTKVGELQEVNKPNHKIAEFASKNSNKHRKRNTINTDSNLENNNNNNNNHSNFINQTNLGDSVDHIKSSFQKKLEKQKSNQIQNLEAAGEEKDFDKALLDLINLIRKNPIYLVDKIISFMGKIKKDKSTNKNYYLLNAKTKISLKKGKEAFLSCCDYLTDLSQKIHDKSLVLNELELVEELKFPFPSEHPDSCNDKEYLTLNMLRISEKIVDKKMRIVGFHYDLSTNDAETSLILQVVDDNNSNGKRRNIIFDEKSKYIGISHGRVKDNVYCIYFLFAT